MERVMYFMIGIACGYISYCVGYRVATQKWHVHSRWRDGRCENCGSQTRVRSIGFGCTHGSIRVDYEETEYCHRCGAMMR